MPVYDPSSPQYPAGPPYLDIERASHTLVGENEQAVFAKAKQGRKC